MNALEVSQRAAVIAEAKTWLGTPFRDCSNVKGAGADCAMSLIEWFSRTGVIEWFDPRPYPSQWLEHHDEEKFLGFVEKLGIEVFRSPIPGDVIVYKFGRVFAHGALVIDALHVIHAYKLQSAVVISPLHETLLCQLNNGKPRPRKIFDCWAGR